MFGTIVVPLDGSDVAARALVPAARLAELFDSKIHVAGFATPLVAEDLAGQIRRHAADVDPRRLQTTVAITSRSVVDGIAEIVEGDPGSLVVMSSVGHSHTGRALGSVGEAVLRRLFGPVVLIGPTFTPASFALPGKLTASVDGSEMSESILPVAEAWALAGHLELEIVTVIDPDTSRQWTVNADLPNESGAVSRLARRAGQAIGRPVGYEVLHHRDPARAIVRWATDTETSMIALSTHGSGGLSRLVTGSVAMSVVHRAPCPVLMLRPPHLREV